MRAREKKLKDAKAGRKKELKSKKPSKEVMETHLRAGASISNIAKKYDSSVQSVHNWIRSYGLAGIQGVKKPIEDMVQGSPTLAEIEQFHTDDPVQELPIVEIDRVPGCFSEYKPKIYWCSDCNVKAECLTSFNKLHPEPLGMTEEENMTDEEWEATDPIPEPTIGELWEDAEAVFATIQRKYEEQADKDYRAQLAKLVLAVTKGQGLFG
jgi:transposase-like protein